MKTINNLRICTIIRSISKIKEMSACEFAEYAFDLIADSHHGIYAPKVACEYLKQISTAGLEADFEAIETAIDEEYFEAWGNVEGQWEYSHNGIEYGIWTNETGDIFLINKSAIELWETITGKNFAEEY